MEDTGCQSRGSTCTHAHVCVRTYTCVHTCMNLNTHVYPIHANKYSCRGGERKGEEEEAEEEEQQEESGEGERRMFHSLISELLFFLQEVSSKQG